MMNGDSIHLPPGQCCTEEHQLHRRLFLKGMTGGALATVSSFAGLFHNPVFAARDKEGAEALHPALVVRRAQSV